jgi:LysM repeat protein
MEKAQIHNIDESSEAPIVCLFNPNEYTFSKRNTWSKKEVKGKNVPELEFGGGDSMTLVMQLFFDTYVTGEDVRKTASRIWKLMNINDKLTDMTSVKGRPPKVEFQWGATWSFIAVITDIKQRFTLFREDGTPVRATMDVTFMQASDQGKYPGQNPTTVGKPGYKRRMVKQGDTIDWIAFEEYGDSSMWRLIAETNDLDNPKILKPGQILSISPPN